jgi:hypothetical protein
VPFFLFYSFWSSPRPIAYTMFMSNYPHRGRFLSLTQKLTIILTTMIEAFLISRPKRKIA